MNESQTYTSIEDQVLSALRRISRAVALHSSYMMREYGLTGPQLMVMRQIKSSGAMTIKALSDSVSLSHATVTGILGRLEDKGLLARESSSDDKRKKLVSLTPSGEELLKQAPPPLQSRFVDELKKLEKWEQTQLLSSLQRVSCMMGAEDLAAAPVLMTEEGESSDCVKLAHLSPGKK